MSFLYLPHSALPFSNSTLPSQQTLAIRRLADAHSCPTTLLHTLDNTIVVEYIHARLPDSPISPSINVNLVSDIAIFTTTTTIDMSSRRPTVRPMVVEFTPDNAPSNLAPSSPPSPKAVRFAPTSDNRLSRPLTSTEAWSLYYFENHARQCSACIQPLEVYRRGDCLCETGHGLAQDVACHVYYRDGEIYSNKRDEDAKVVRVEIPHGYVQLRSLLKAMDHRIRRSRHRTVPILSYDRSYPVSARRYSSTNDGDNKPTNVIIEPAISNRPRHRSSKHSSVRYSTVEVDHDDIERVSGVKGSAPSTSTTTTTSSSSRRGSLYEKDMQRRQKDYHVEIREPSSSDYRKERRKSHRDSGIWI